LDIHERNGVDLWDRPSVGAQTVAVLEKVLARTVGVKRLETEFADQAQNSLLTGAHPLPTDFNDLAVTNGVVERTAAHTVSRLDHHDVDPVGSKRPGGRQASKPRTYDHDGG
jgi:hypothetical protein